MVTLLLVTWMAFPGGLAGKGAAISSYQVVFHSPDSCQAAQEQIQMASKLVGNGGLTNAIGGNKFPIGENWFVSAVCAPDPVPAAKAPAQQPHN